MLRSLCCISNFPLGTLHRRTYEGSSLCKTLSVNSVCMCISLTLLYLLISFLSLPFLFCSLCLSVYLCLFSPILSVYLFSPPFSLSLSLSTFSLICLLLRLIHCTFLQNTHPILQAGESSGTEFGIHLDKITPRRGHRNLSTQAGSV